MPNITEIKCKQACTKVDDKGGLPSWNLNHYRGCMHRCIYCFAIYSHDYLQDGGNYFDNIYVKTNIVSRLEKQLSSPSWKGDEIGISGVTDCYQPLEAKYKLMPDILKVLIRHKNPCSISTKSDLILRDYDLIEELSRVAHVHINASISCMDNEIRKKIEPGAKDANKKFQMLKEFSKLNVTTGMLQMPIIPYITDSRENIEQLYANAANSKVNFVVPGVLYLKGKTRGVFFDGIKREFPELLQPLQQLYRNGKADKTYKNSLYQMVHELKRKYRLTSSTPPQQIRKKEMEEIKKVAKGYEQLSLFDTNTTTPQTYQSAPIPSREQLAKSKPPQPTTQAVAEKDLASFVEIEMGSDNSATSPTSVTLPSVQPIDKVTCEKRTLFYSMRQIARDTAAYADHAKIFYEQALLMQDFEDDYEEPTPFSSYFPYYQRMGYDQLRTYFTWRTKIRKGQITTTSTSYAFLYLYELLNQIGVENPEDGLEKLMTFWQTFRTYDATLDQYVLQWLKDYHIYYPLPHSFKEFAQKQQLINHYPLVFGYNSDKENSFALFSGISKYNIKKSVFFTDENKEIINDSFYFILERFREHFQSKGQCFEDLIFYPLAKVVTWTPFNRALFYPAFKQPEKRQVAISDKEVYNYNGTRWQYKSVMLSDHGRQLVGYIMKEMECSLRKIVKFKYKLTANPNVCDDKALATFEQVGISLAEFIQASVQDFYALRTRKIITVDTGNLKQIRQDALKTQEKLIVPEEADPIKHIPEQPVSQPILTTVSTFDQWDELKKELTDIEIEALKLILDGQSIKEFALKKMVMLEVLVDGINDKAMDSVGDTLLELDDVVMIYNEYRENLIEMVKL